MITLGFQFSGVLVYGIETITIFMFMILSSGFPHRHQQRRQKQKSKSLLTWEMSMNMLLVQPHKRKLLILLVNFCSCVLLCVEKHKKSWAISSNNPVITNFWRHCWSESALSFSIYCEASVYSLSGEQWM